MKTKYLLIVHFIFSVFLLIRKKSIVDKWNIEFSKWITYLPNNQEEFTTTINVENYVSNSIWVISILISLLGVAMYVFKKQLNLWNVILYFVLLSSSVFLITYFPYNQLSVFPHNEIFINGGEQNSITKELIPILISTYWHVRLGKFLFVAALIIFGIMLLKKNKFPM